MLPGRKYELLYSALELIIHSLPTDYKWCTQRLDKWVGRKVGLRVYTL